MEMKRYLNVAMLFFVVSIFNACKEKQKEVIQNTKPLFYGKIVYSSTFESPDTVFKLNMEAISPYKIEVYIDENNFRMIEYGGLSHSNLILDKSIKAAWQLDTIKKLAYLGEYSDLGDPTAELRDLMPDHFKPIVESTNEKETILGHPCTKYKILRSGFIPADNEAFIWVADDFRIPASRYDIQTEINHAAVPAPLILGYEDGAIMRLTVKTKSYTRSFEITELQKDLFPTGIFEIPEGYQKK